MHLHIVAFNIPWPADYGGVIDVFYRVKALADAGVKVHLHCFAYGRDEAPELAQLCHEVHYYHRRTGILSQLSVRPYIVSSRESQELLVRLQEDSYPILLEGLHCCALLEKLDTSSRLIYVRTHNVEHYYYSALARAEHTLWRRLFFRLEAARLRRYETVLRQASAVLAISETDASHFLELGCRNVLLLPPCHGNSRVCSLPGCGDYILYHGNLSVPENEHAALYLIRKVFFGLQHRLVIAGRNPGEAISSAVAQCSNVSLVADPEDEELDELIRKAHVNILVTDQATGVKLKLLNALYKGRFCLVNSSMVQGTNLADACVVADTPESQQSAINSLMSTPFDEQQLQHRKSLLPPSDPARTIIGLMAQV